MTCYERTQDMQWVGIVGLSTSRKAVMVASLLSIFQIPSIGTLSSSDELSDKTRYEYYLRLVPPDKFQARAVVDLLVHFNWTYASLLFSEGSYGENGAKQIVFQAKAKGVCLAVEKKISTDATAADYIELVKLLYFHKNARAVVLFMGVFYLRQIFEAAKSLGMSNEFFWIGGDTFALYSFEDLPVDGALSITFTSARNNEFEDYYRTLTPANLPRNPWMPKQWQLLYECNWDENASQSCNLFQDTPYPRYDFTKWYSRAIDGVYTYAYALDDYIRNECPGAVHDAGILKTCISGPLLLSYLRNTSFMGVTGDIVFDSKGDIIGGYDLLQLRHINGSETWNVFGDWDMVDGLSVDSNKIDLTMFLPDHGSETDVPESVCSKPCKVGEAYIQQELHCCWECRSCRRNEIVSMNMTDCIECPTTTWPDETVTECLPIEPTYLLWSDSLVHCLAVLGLLGILSSFVIAGAFIAHRDTKLVKASSRELSSIILGGIFLAYVSVFFFLLKPSKWSCALNRFGFSISITLIYAPMLVKTNRIYRIFASAQKTTRRPQFISPRSQVLASLLLFMMETIILMVILVIYPSDAELRMRVPNEKHVELFCNLPLPGMLAPLSFILLLTFGCACFGFLTRKLPENFNESWYIFVSVSTTIFIWIVILPTYFTTFYAYYQAALLAACLLLIASITLLCLYVPKLYAIYFVNENKLSFGTAVNSVTPSTHVTRINIQSTKGEPSAVSHR